MEHSTAQRRLVKSPPELWAEVSSESLLSRRFAEFGEIRITRVEPETTVAWEGDRASGTVELAPAGWGTKVTLTATPLAGRASAREAEPTVEAGATAETEQPARMEPTTEAGATAEPESQSERELPPRPEPAAIATAPEPPPDPAPAPAPRPRRRGFFARLFRRRPKTAPELEIPAPGPPAPDPSPPAPGPDPLPPGPGPAPPGPVPDPMPPAPDPSPLPPPSILVAPDALPDPPPVAAGARPPLDAERTVAILTEVLDDLGAAHHRPFSRD